MAKVQEITGNVYDFHYEIATHDVNLAWKVYAAIQDAVNHIAEENPNELQHNFFVLKCGGQDYPRSKKEYNAAIAREKREERKKLEDEHRQCLMKIAHLEQQLRKYEHEQNQS